MRQATTADVDSICRIYNHYIESSTITFEEIPVSPAEMAERITETTTGSLPWLVEEANGSVVGYAYASKWKSRSAYRYAVETTIYFAPNVHRMGIGTRLYKELLLQLKERSMHVAIGGIALPNDA